MLLFFYMLAHQWPLSSPVNNGIVRFWWFSPNLICSIFVIVVRALEIFFGYVFLRHGTYTRTHCSITDNGQMPQLVVFERRVHAQHLI